MTKNQNFFTRYVGYQIYPRSFMDANNDGVGDLPGIIQKLDYLDWLGVNLLWLSPIYPSPMADFGYDVADYENIDPIFGSLDDFDQLVAAAQQKNMDIILDFVINHTSDQHQWFKESRSDRNSAKRDWYIWKDPKPDGSPPNNWLSVFGGSAWKLDENTQQYYLHSFLKEQPDLNWHNPQVQKAMQDAAQFWLDRGVQGFRFDAVPWLGKDQQFRDNPINPHYSTEWIDPYGQLEHIHSVRQSTMNKFMSIIAEVVVKHDDGLIIAEYYPEVFGNPREVIKIYESVNPPVLAPFNFAATELTFSANAYKNYLDEYYKLLPQQYQAVNVLGNHDKSRIASRINPDAARMLMLMIMTLPGLPFIYYGEEINMTNAELAPEDILDPFANIHPSLGRDQVRTPMQWDNAEFGGFSNHKPWLPVRSSPNVKDSKLNENSMLNFTKALIGLRKTQISLQDGGYEPLETGLDQVYAFKRITAHESITIALNFTEQDLELDFIADDVKIIISTHDNPSKDKLRPFEGIILKAI